MLLVLIFVVPLYLQHLSSIILFSFGMVFLLLFVISPLFRLLNITYSRTTSLSLTLISTSTVCELARHFVLNAARKI